MTKSFIKILSSVQGRQKNIRIDVAGLSYYDIVIKLTKLYNLPSKIYHFYYYDRQNQIVSISCEQDFLISLSHNINTKYYLQQAQQIQFHWLPLKSPNDQPPTLTASYVQSFIDKKRTELVQQIQEFQQSTRQKIRQQVNSKIKSIQTAIISNNNETIHKGFYCSSCNDNKDIEGDRYRCLFCKQFNLCSLCEFTQNYKHEDRHPFIKITKEAQNMLVERWQKEEETRVPKVEQSQDEIKFMQFTGSSKQTYNRWKKRYPKASEGELITYYLAEQ